MEHGIPHMGEVIRNMRKQKGYTQDALAQAAGVSVQAVSKWETGQSMPDVALLPAIADFLEVAIDALFGRSVCQTNEEPTEQVGSSFPHDGRLRVVQYLGDRMMDAQECIDGREIRLYIEDSSQKADIEIRGSARISGPVNGAAHASGDLFISGDINGSARADGDITCEGRIQGMAQGNKTRWSVEWQSGLNGALKGLGSALSDMKGAFGRAFSSGRTDERMEAFFRGELPDDDILRVVQMRGRRILNIGESSGAQKICLDAEHLDGRAVNVEIYGSAEIRGNVGGSVKAGDALTCGNVGGDAHAGDGMTCGSVSGNAQAGDTLTCGKVEGSVRAGDSVCVSGDICGNVSAGDSVTCGVIGGNVRANSIRYSSKEEIANTNEEEAVCAVSSDSADAVRVVRIKNGQEVSAQDYAGEKRIHLTFEEAEGICVTVQGSALIEGDVQGDVLAQGSLVCGDVEGDVHAQGQSADAQIQCGTVSGNVNVKNISLTCGDIEGDITAEGRNSESLIDCDMVSGNVNVKNVSITCRDVEGDITAEGENAETKIDCDGVSGNVNVKNAFLTCQDIEGDVTAEGGNADTRVECDVAAGNVTVKNASFSCDNADGDLYIEGMNAETHVKCGVAAGDVRVKNAHLTCRNIDGDLTIEGQIDFSRTDCGSVGGEVYRG